MSKKSRNKNATSGGLLKHYKAPRSMTPAEAEYHAKHKHLNGFYNIKKKAA